MSSKVKNSSSKKQKELSKFSFIGNKLDEKENKYSNSKSKGKKHLKEPVKSQCEEIRLKELHEPVSSLKPEAKEKPLGFWSKKLQDLEENINKKKECGLYDFNESDESDFCCKRKKKVKPKAKLLKRVQPVISRCNKPASNEQNMDKISKLEKKMKDTHRQSFCREKIMLRKERSKLAKQGTTFTFSTGMPYLGITSTPAVNKNNLIGPSNFLFLSPVSKEDAKYCSSVRQSLPLGEKIIDNGLPTVSMSQETPKVKTKLKNVSCKRTLRNGKILNY